MGMGRRRRESQGELFVAADRLPVGEGHAFYERLNRLLAEAGFGEAVEALCEPYYASDEKRGRPSIPPTVYFRMLMVGYFEGLGSQRGFAWRCDDRLTKTKCVWLKSHEYLSEKQRATLEGVFTLQLKTGKAWAYKELLCDLWNHDDAASAIVFFNDWYKRVIHTKLEPMKRVARTIKERLGNLVSYCTHGITNAVAEGINSKTIAIKRRVGGYRNRQNFKTAIFFYCGGLDLHPR